MHCRIRKPLVALFFTLYFVGCEKKGTNSPLTQGSQVLNAKQIEALKKSVETLETSTFRNKASPSRETFPDIFDSIDVESISAVSISIELEDERFKPQGEDSHLSIACQRYISHLNNEKVDCGKAIKKKDGSFLLETKISDLKSPGDLVVIATNSSGAQLHSVIKRLPRSGAMNITLNRMTDLRFTIWENTRLNFFNGIFSLRMINKIASDMARADKLIQDPRLTIRNLLGIINPSAFRETSEQNLELYIKSLMNKMAVQKMRSSLGIPENSENLRFILTPKSLAAFACDVQTYNKTLAQAENLKLFPDSGYTLSTCSESNLVVKEDFYTPAEVPVLKSVKIENDSILITLAETKNSNRTEYAICSTTGVCYRSATSIWQSVLTAADGTSILKIPFTSSQVPSHIRVKARNQERLETAYSKPLEIN